MRTSTVIATACLSAASALVAPPARADYVQSANPPPPPAQKAETTVPRATGPHEGLEAAGALGTGFAGTYAFGLEARAGYTWSTGIYLGGNAQYYFGNAVNNTNAYAFFIGPELGYKIFIDQLEIRPGQANQLRFMNRVAPNFIQGQLSKSVDRMLAGGA